MITTYLPPSKKKNEKTYKALGTLHEKFVQIMFIDFQFIKGRRSVQITIYLLENGKLTRNQTTYKICLKGIKI